MLIQDIKKPNMRSSKRKLRLRGRNILVVSA